MSTQLIKNYYQAFNEKNWDKFFTTLHPSVIHEINESHTEVGIEAFKKFIDRMNHSYNEKIEQINLYTGEKSNTFAASYKVNGQYLKTDEGLPPAKGQTYLLQGGAFFEIEDEKIKLVRNYYNLNEWLSLVTQ